MPSVQYYAAASLDGYIARPGGDLGWLTGYQGPGGGAKGPFQDGSYDEFFAGIGAIVMGSATYEWMLQHASSWPYEVPSFVFTSRDLAPREDGDIKMVRGSVEGVHAEVMAAADGQNLWVLGGGNLASQYVASGLLDELRVTIVPVVLGEGLPLFAEGVPGELRLEGQHTSENGMVELRYHLPQ
jgi:dihydrofolate reductase